MEEFVFGFLLCFFFWFGVASLAYEYRRARWLALADRCFHNSKQAKYWCQSWKREVRRARRLRDELLRIRREHPYVR